MRGRKGKGDVGKGVAAWRRIGVESRGVLGVPCWYEAPWEGTFVNGAILLCHRSPTLQLIDCFLVFYIETLQFFIRRVLTCGTVSL